MKDTYIKELRRLLESEVEEAEVIIAAKGFSQELQDMIEKVGRLMNEDLGPVVDQMRLTYGVDTAESFNSSMFTELNNVITTLRDAKSYMDDAVMSISSGQPLGSQNDMDVADDDFGTEVDSDVDGDVDGDVIGDFERDIEGDDEFGGEIGLDEPLGRAAKESTESRTAELMNMIVEMRSQLKQIRNKKIKNG